MSTIDIHVAAAFREVDAEAWTDVTTRSAAPVQYAPAYLRSYEAAPLSPFLEVRYLTAAQDGRATAVLPCYLQERPDPYGALRSAGLPVGDGPALLGHNWYCYDTRVPMLAGTPARRDRVLHRMLDTLADTARADGASTAGLVNVTEDDPVLQVARDKGWSTAPMVTRFQLPIAGVADYEGYLERLGARTRGTIRRYLRRAADAGATTVVEPPTPDVLKTVCQLTRLTAAKHGSDDMYPEGPFVDFVMGLGDRALVVRVDQGPETLAGAVVLLDDERLHMWVGGTPYATVDSYSPNYLLWATEIRTAIDLGKVLVEGGRANQPMKRRHGMNPLPLWACVTPVAR
ncbi:GNAT family N-acetyltransferase [Streptomyces sp. SL13]|uniref:GNAT family N-acetyltransferase n=1 Tax=Streptantibioticus silvisoli TaxID=2705255 RepID=A0AA90K6L1_9ACTN|nr:GNAT family N-acetyltransferase [Streptantibioticus silvisoli]MDI5967843.1 GNAT family N-acetyltransferase [Streptantibioticus silvisoli]